jgi:hypothetical protein
MPKTKSTRIANKRRTKNLRGGETELLPVVESYHSSRKDKKSSSSIGVGIGLISVAIIGVMAFLKSR